MADKIQLIEYTPDVAQAIRNARDIHLLNRAGNPWPEHQRQTLLSSMMADADVDVTSKHPFDVELVTGGTEESQTYSVRVFNSALPESPYAGIVYLGTIISSVPVDELEIETSGDFWVDLVVTYNAETSPRYMFEFEVRTDPNIEDNNNVFRQAIAEGKLPKISSVQNGNITVTGRWV